MEQTDTVKFQARWPKHASVSVHDACMYVCNKYENFFVLQLEYI